MFSKACEYGIRAAIYIAGQSFQDKRVSLKDISRQIDSPIAFTAKILQQLAKNNILLSIKGPNGGFEIEKQNLNKIQLSDIVSSIDGDDIFNGCGLGLKICSEQHPCPVHDSFKEIRENLKNMLETTSLYELAIKLNNGHTHLKR